MDIHVHSIVAYKLGQSAHNNTLKYAGVVFPPISAFNKLGRKALEENSFRFLLDMMYSQAD